MAKLQSWYTNLQVKKASLSKCLTIGSLKDVTELRDLENRLVGEKIQRQKEISETIIEV
jgi:hypothetical protein